MANHGEVRAFQSSKNVQFEEACETAKIPVTRRQAAKWLMKKGLAYKTMKEG